jgi:hypothetical protein
LAPFWTFTDLVPVERQRAMLALIDLSEVTALVASCPVAHFQLESKRHGYCAGTQRAFFKIDAGGGTYDAFFNSPVGIRSQYCRSVEQGEKANRQLLDSITPTCLTHSGVIALSLEEQRLVQISLASITAKMWINDADWNHQDDTQILHAPWLAKAAASDTGTSAEQVARYNARTGLLAPLGRYIEVKGGWISQFGELCIDSDKVNRSQEIRDYGCV